MREGEEPGGQWRYHERGGRVFQFWRKLLPPSCGWNISVYLLHPMILSAELALFFWQIEGVTLKGTLVYRELLQDGRRLIHSRCQLMDG